MERQRPRIVRIDLGRPEPVRPFPWRSTSAGIDRVGAWSGTALALALLHEHAVAFPEAESPLVLSVGECVRRALPTAARATVASRSPLTGLLAEGQVGSDLGRRLARIADAIVIEGSTDVPGAVLVLTDRGAERVDVEILSRPGRLDACAMLRAGRAGARGIPFACLAAGDDPPSFVGRGGLGAVLGRLGLTAIAIRAEPVEPDPDEDHGGLLRLLARSPRLRARAEGGTLEAAGALAARGDLGRTGPGPVLSPSEAGAWSTELPAGDRPKKGCEGCPTPCGFVFERGFPGGEKRLQGARFGALYALGPNLGLARAEDALALLAACDEAGLDAIETGAVLALLAERPNQALMGDRDALLARIEDLVEGRGDGKLLALGARGLARELGIEARVRTARGQGARADASLAAVLGQCAGARGSDSMRTTPFLLADASPSRLRELLAPIPLPRGAEDPRDPIGKGRIVWWHENLMAAIDATGFCAFSAAGLLADGVCDLDELAAAISPGWPELSTGRALLAAGASIVTIARDLGRRYGARAEDDTPEWAREALAHPGMWPEYAAVRGLDSSGGPSPETWSRLASESILEVGAAVLSPAVEAQTAPRRNVETRPGRVSLRCFGPLARELGTAASDGLVRVEIDLPASLRDVLAAAASAHPRALRYLLQDGEPLAAAYRASRRLAADAPVNDGDELDVVVALSGGACLS